MQEYMTLLKEAVMLINSSLLFKKKFSPKCIQAEEHPDHIPQGERPGLAGHLC